MTARKTKSETSGTAKRFSLQVASQFNAVETIQENFYSNSSK
jgi:hypothetical protein